MGYSRKPNYHFKSKDETGIDKVPEGRIVVIEDYENGISKTFVKPALTLEQIQYLEEKNIALSEMTMQTFAEVAKVEEKEALSRESLLAYINSGALQLTAKTQFLGIKRSEDRNSLEVHVFDEDEGKSEIAGFEDTDIEVNPDDYLYWIIEKDIHFNINAKGNLLLSKHK